MKIKIIHLNIKELLFVLIIMSMIFFVFAFKYINPVFNYVDDIVTVIFLLFAIIKIMVTKSKKNLNKYDKYIFVLGCILIIVGFFGNLISGYQISIRAIAIDLLSFCKFFGIYLAGMIIFKTDKSDRYYEIAEYFSKFVLLICLFIAIGNMLFDWGLADNKNRYGITVYSLGGHPSFASAVTCCCSSILLFNYSKNKKWILLGFILTILTVRMKSIVYVALMGIYLLLYNKNKYFSLKNIVLYAGIGIIIARQYIINYFFDVTASRGAALNASIKLASKFFPIGTGFATFGTVQSITSYSRAYKIVGLDNRYGFMKTAGSFVGDGGWATEIGQFGIIGVITLIMMFLFIYCSIKENIGKKANYAPFISILLYILICSTSEISFASNYAVLFAVALVILIKKGAVKNEKI